jgi:aminoglycoside 3-N-acetyltransferase
MDYDRSSISRCIGSLPLERGDVVFVHSDVARFGVPAKDVDVLLCLYDAIMTAIGDTGTLVVPTFTYSFSRGKAFDVNEPCPEMGVFAEWVRNVPGAVRSLDPFYSVAAVGWKAYELAGGVMDNSFGPGSFFARFSDAGGKILTMNLGAGSTFIHYVEREMQVPYRFDKQFSGTVVSNDAVMTGVEHVIYVRRLVWHTLADFEAFDSLARQHALYKTAPLGRGEIGVITAEATRKLIKATLPSRPLFLTSGDRAISSELREPTTSI